MNRLRFGQPTLFDIPEDVVNEPDVQDSPVPNRETSGLRHKTRADSINLRISQNLPPAPVARVKRRKRYQFGSLTLEPRTLSPDVWVFRYTSWVNGKKVRPKVIVGTILDYPTKADAQRACEHLRMEANEECAHLSVTTVRGLIDRYIDEVLRLPLSTPLGGSTGESARVEYTTARNYMNSIRNYILPRWEAYSVRDFEKPEVHAVAEKWFYSLLRSEDQPSGLAPKSVRQIYAAMGQIFKFGAKWGYLKFNPFSGPNKRIELPRGSTKRLKVPTQITPVQFLSLIGNLIYFPAKLAVAFAGWMGLRVSEIFGLQWQDLDLELGIVKFRRGYSHQRISRLKTEASRAIFSIPKQVLELLRNWHSLTPYNGPADWVFASPAARGKRPFSAHALMMGYVQPVARALGLPEIGWHTFRHSMSAWTKTFGMSAEDRKTLLRHQSLTMGDLYGEAELERKRELQNRVALFVEEQVKSRKSDNVPAGRKSA